MEGLLAVSPYVNGPFNSHAKGVAVLAEAVAAAALSDLNQLANMAYLKHKLEEWYSDAPRPARKQPTVDADSPRQPTGTRRRQPRPTLPLVEATAVGLHSISKVYRPEFDVRGAPERAARRAPDRDRAVPGLHSAVFGSRPQ
jgi:hypothetical protein